MIPASWFRSRRTAYPLAVVVLLVLTGCAQPAQPLPPRTIPFTDVNPYGVNIFLGQEVEEWKMRRELQMIKDAGIGYVKQEIPWSELEPERGQFVDTKFGKPSWAKWDKRLSLINEFGLQTIVRLDRPPHWTRQDNSDPEAPPDHFSDFGDFVYNVVNHLKKVGVHYYQLWNEPNSYPGWGNKPPDPAAYTRLLKIGYQRAKQADPNAVILSAPLAITLEHSARNMSDLDFLKGMYAAGAKSSFDIMSANAYGESLPPSDPASPAKLNFQRVTLLHRIMVQNGDANKPVWFDEFGWNASPAGMSPSKLKWGQVTEQQQAQYTRDAIRMARTQWPWVGVISIWYFRQDGTRDLPSQSGYYFRMVNPDFSPTPLYAAIASETKGLNIAQPGQYQETDPAVQLSAAGSLHDDWQLRLDPRASDGAYYASETAGARMLITFRGTSIDLKTMNAPTGGVVLASVDGSSLEANKLRRNTDGKASFDEYAPRTAYQQDVPSADGLSFGKHVLELTVSGKGDAAAQGAYAFVDGFTVGG